VTGDLNSDWMRSERIASAVGLVTRATRENRTPGILLTTQAVCHWPIAAKLVPVGGIEPPRPHYEGGPLPLRLDRPDDDGRSMWRRVQESNLPDLSVSSR
jgi:hypothetical protein